MNRTAVVVRPTVVLVAGLLATAALRPGARSQVPAQAPIGDAVTADPTHYTVEFQNREVRVLRIHYGPHEKGNMHTHPRSVTVFLTDGTLRMTTPDGHTKTGSPKAGTVVWESAGPHQPENLTDQPFEAIRIEFKTPEPPHGAKWGSLHR